MIARAASAKRYGEKRVLARLDLDVARGGFLLVTGPNGSGKTTLLRLVAGLAVPSGGELAVDATRGQLGFLAHEPLVYRELTALENLDLYGRLYRVPERRERIGMLLERFGLWDARNERAGSFSRGMLQRLALCRVFLHEPELLLLDEPFSALDADGAALLDRELARAARPRDVPRRDARAGADRTARDGAPGVRVSGTSPTSRALARKDLLLELRARDTLPAMLLFVVRGARRLPLRAAESGRSAAGIGLLWVAIVFTALLGLSRAFVAEREQGVLDGLVLAPSDRSAIWLGKSLAALAFLALAEVVALPLFALFFSGIDGRTVAARRARGHRHLHRRRRSSRRWRSRRRARELLLPLLFLPLAIPVIVGGVGASVRASRGAICFPRSTTPSSRCSRGPRLSTSSSSRESAHPKLLYRFL